MDSFIRVGTYVLNLDQVVWFEVLHDLVLVQTAGTCLDSGEALRFTGAEAEALAWWLGTHRPAPDVMSIYQRAKGA